jgi:hypothetical protein
MVKDKDPMKIAIGPLKPKEPQRAPKDERGPKQLMTLPVPEREKHLLEDLGRKIQTSRSVRKKPELNWKSILRAFIGSLDSSSFDGVSVANEEELREYIKKKVRL